MCISINACTCLLLFYIWTRQLHVQCWKLFWVCLHLCETNIICSLRKKNDLEIRPGLTLSCSPSSGVKTKVPPSLIAGVFVLRTVSLCLSSVSVLCIVSALQNPGYITAAGSLNRGRAHEWWMQGEECDRKQRLNHVEVPGFLILFFFVSLYDSNVYIWDFWIRSLISNSEKDSGEKIFRTFTEIINQRGAYVAEKDLWNKGRGGGGGY